MGAAADTCTKAGLAGNCKSAERQCYIAFCTAILRPFITIGRVLLCMIQTKYQANEI